MANTYFQFKQFRIEQDKCAMKVCTDSCILGAYAAYPEPERILDIGTGSGLLSLMLAQRFNCAITAIEIDSGSFNQAKSNFDCSPWKGRIQIVNTAIQKYHESNAFDLIVCNPPFFNNHLKSPSSLKNIALHNDSLSFEDLANSASMLMSEKGHFYNLLPLYESKVFTEIALSYSLVPFKELKIYHSSGKSVFRVITAYAKTTQVPVEEELIIKTEEGEYTPAFKNLLKEYYLNL